MGHKGLHDLIYKQKGINVSAREIKDFICYFLPKKWETKQG